MRLERITVSIPIVLLLAFWTFLFFLSLRNTLFGYAENIIKMCVDFGQNPFFIFFSNGIVLSSIYMCHFDDFFSSSRWERPFWRCNHHSITLSRKKETRVKRITVSIPIVLLLAFWTFLFFLSLRNILLAMLKSIIKMCVDFGQSPFFIFFQTKLSFQVYMCHFEDFFSSSHWYFKDFLSSSRLKTPFWLCWKCVLILGRTLSSYFFKTKLSKSDESVFNVTILLYMQHTLKKNV